MQHNLMQAAPQDTPRGAPSDPDKILRTAWSEAFPDHRPELVEELLKRQQTAIQAGGRGPRHFAPPPTT
jgi:hypothetical protein